MEPVAVAVIGAGLMGHGIALEYALHGNPVRLTDSDLDRFPWALERIREGLSLLCSSGAISEQRIGDALKRIQIMPDLEACAEGAEVVVEAVFEDLELKRRLYRIAEGCIKPNAILASNTSTIMPSRLAEGLRHPKRLLVTHYFNPPYLLPLVEVAPAPGTDSQVVAAMTARLESMGKRPVVLKREIAGFVGNRLQAALFREAISLIEQGVATPADIDAVVTTSFGRRLAHVGPFVAGDFAGWDLFLTILGELQPQLCNAESPSRLVAEKVARGELGAKSGAGFHSWPGDSADVVRRRLAGQLARFAAQDRGVATE